MKGSAELLKERVRINILFQNGKLKVRQLAEKDQSLLAKWLSDPAVLEFYEGRDNPFDVEKIKNQYYTSGDQISRCIVEWNEQEIGYIQYYELEEMKLEVMERTYGTDQFIGEVEYWNQGIGTLLVSSMVKYLIETKKAKSIVMDPQTRNTRAIKCYQKCGFKKVRILPDHELHEGTYQDCWLIEYRK